MTERFSKALGIALLAMAIALASGCGYYEHDYCCHHDGHYWGHHYDRY